MNRMGTYVSQSAYKTNAAIEAMNTESPTPPLSLVAAPVNATADVWKGLGPVVPEAPAGEVSFLAG